MTDYDTQFNVIRNSSKMTRKDYVLLLTVILIEAGLLLILRGIQ